MVKCIAFLRGINVGGHHKVPMADLKSLFEKLGYENIITILNTGNIIFDTNSTQLDQLEKTISINLKKHFGFPIPTIVRKAETIHQLYQSNPFENITVHKDIRLYISFLKEDKPLELDIPWISTDQSFKIILVKEKTVLSILDLSASNTPKAMEVLEKAYGKENITTRNWKTIERIIKKL